MKKQYKIHQLLPLFAGSIALLVALVPVSAAVLLEEIVVTAQKQEQNLQDVSVSVSALSGDQIKDLGFSDTTDVTQQIPNLQLNAWSPNLTIFNLRGISQNNFTDNLEAPVAVYFDDAYMASINGISGHLFDMERAEVLRGPQGTLFGRNATGGLIHYVSKGATEDEFNGYINLEGGDYGRQSLEIALGGGSRNVRARFALRAEELDGYIESENTFIPGDPADPTDAGVTFRGSGRDIGGKDGYAIRLNMQFDLNDRLTADFWLKYSQDDDVSTGGYVFENCDLDADGLCPVDEFGRTVTTEGVINARTGERAGVHEHFGENPGFLDRETWSIQGKFEYDLGDDRKFVSITNQLDLRKRYVEDGDALPLVVVNFQTDLDYEQLSQEFRFSGERDFYRWQAGLYYLNIESVGDVVTTGAPAFFNIGAEPTGTAPGLRQVSRIEAAGGTHFNNTTGTGAEAPSPGNSFHGAVGTQLVDLVSRNWSIFGQVEFDVHRDVVITAGLRWSRDDKDIDWRLTYVDDNNPTSLLISSGDILSQERTVDEINYGDFAARFAVDWRLSPDVLLFASLNRGIKGGNWAVGAGSNINAETFRHEPEVLTSLEIGVKSEIADVLRINATVYSYDYSDYQAFSLAGGAPFVANTDAEATGGEVEVFWNPTPSWDVIFGLSVSDSQVEEVIGSGGGDPILNAELPNAPDLSFNFLARYNWLFSGNEFSVQLDGVYYGDQFLEVTNGPGTLQESYTVANARIIYKARNDISFSAWVKNITDEEYKVYSLDLGVLGTTTYYAPPLTSGISFNYRF